MKLVTCNRCGADEIIEKNGLFVCCYCGSKYVIEQNEKNIYSSMKKSNNQKSSNSGIDLNDDVQRLLDKCKKEPWKARQYANLVLDIDPGNREALRYL